MTTNLTRPLWVPAPHRCGSGGEVGCDGRVTYGDVERGGGLVYAEGTCDTCRQVTVALEPSYRRDTSDEPAEFRRF